MNRKLQRPGSRLKPKPTKGQALSQLNDTLKGLGGLENLGVLVERMEPTMVQVEALTRELVGTQEALQMAINAVTAQGKQIKDQRATFLWLLSEVLPHVELETLEARFDQAYSKLQGGKA